MFTVVQNKKDENFNYFSWQRGIFHESWEEIEQGVLKCHTMFGQIDG